MTDALKKAVQLYADRHADRDGFVKTPIDGVNIMRAFGPSGEMRAVYKPVLCLVLQGAKEVMAGDTLYRFEAGQSLIVSVDVPIVGRIVRAHREEPYLALSLDLEMDVVREVMGQLGPAAATPQMPATGGLFVDETDAAVADCAFRLTRLLDRPEAIPVLRPSIVKEMHYWLLVGRHGAAIGALALPDSHTQRIARAVSIIRADFTQTIPVERLAAAAGMSLSSFHQHFKQVTSLSPLQFQKHLRLLEGRRLMLAEGLAVSRAAAEVGYESIPQFTREYARMFGAPPARDIRESRLAA